jgi:hypothetical protein
VGHEPAERTETERSISGEEVEVEVEVPFLREEGEVREEEEDWYALITSAESSMSLNMSSSLAVKPAPHSARRQRSVGEWHKRRKGTYRLSASITCSSPRRNSLIC